MTDDAKKLFVRSLYKKVLNREASMADIEAHYKKNAPQIASDILQSPEANQKNNVNAMSNQDFVKFCYKMILGRDADASGLTTNTNYLNQGNSRGSLIKIFASSQEFIGKRVIATRTITSLNDPLTKGVCDNIRDQGFDAIKPGNCTMIMYEKDMAKITTLDLSSKTNITDYSGLNSLFPNLKTVIK